MFEYGWLSNYRHTHEWSWMQGKNTSPQVCLDFWTSSVVGWQSACKKRFCAEALVPIMHVCPNDVATRTKQLSPRKCGQEQKCKPWNFSHPICWNLSKSTWHHGGFRRCQRLSLIGTRRSHLTSDRSFQLQIGPWFRHHDGIHRIHSSTQVQRSGKPESSSVLPQNSMSTSNWMMLSYF